MMPITDIAHALTVPLALGEVVVIVNLGVGPAWLTFEQATVEFKHGHRVIVTDKSRIESTFFQPVMIRRGTAR